MIHIRTTNPRDHFRVTEIWLESSIVAHDFIAEQYWKQNQKLMEEHYLPLSEVYVAEENGAILAFIAVIDHQVAALFVHPDHQGKGIGNLLLQHVKSQKDVLELNVYQKNTKSLGFYLAKGFEIVSESLDSPSGEKEWVMQWKNQALQQIEPEYSPISPTAEAAFYEPRTIKISHWEIPKTNNHH